MSSFMGKPKFMGRRSPHPAEEGAHTDILSSLWGNPDHLKYLTTSIRERYPDLDVLVPKSNAGSFTYDGAEVGGERVADEVEARLEELRKDGHDIKKFSITGYSFGGLVARYAIGLLYHKGIFQKIEPVVSVLSRQFYEHG